MSELRDLTNALRAFDNRIRGIEDCMIIVLRNSVQEADWRHEQRNNAQIYVSRADEQERAIKQIQEACGAISHKLAEVKDQLDNQADTRRSDVRGLSARLQKLESGEEVTKV
jgi:flagellar motility protein MotE (MotC chaperone)